MAKTPAKSGGRSGGGGGGRIASSRKSKPASTTTTTTTTTTTSRFPGDARADVVRVAMIDSDVHYCASCSLPIGGGGVLGAASRRWDICVGDVVAVHCDESTPPESGSWRPYSVPWSHCQVTAIYWEGGDDDDDYYRVPPGEDGSTSTTTTTTSTSTSNVSASSLRFEIRWFPRISEARLAVSQGRKNRDRLLKCLEEVSHATAEEVIIEGRQISIIDCASLLGQVFVVVDDDDDDEASRINVLGGVVTRRTISDSLSCNGNGEPYIVGKGRIDPTAIVERGVMESTRYPNKSQAKRILDAVLRVRKERLARKTTDSYRTFQVDDGVDGTKTHRAVALGDIAADPAICVSSPQKKRHLFGDDFDDDVRDKRIKLAGSGPSVDVHPRDAQETEADANGDRIRGERKEDAVPNTTIKYETRVRCDIDPFHVDVSALKSFYEEMEILPPVDSYDSRFTGVGDAREGKGTWKVRLGDTVAIEVEKDSKGNGPAHFPFVVQWAPCEVVTIYRLHKTKGSCARLRERVTERDHQGGDAVAGTSQEAVDGEEVMIEIRWLYRPWEIPGASKKKSESIDGRLEEVFETDQVDVCSADSILSPVHLHDAIMPPTVPRSVLGMPIVHYHCSRFWSIHRRSFVPSGSLSNRVSRGRMHSAYKAAFSRLERLSSAGIASPSGNKSWREDFQSAIQKLSLAEAAQDAQENGMVLSCRETERAQIIGFLRKAISGLAQPNKHDGGEEEEIKNLKSSLFIAGPPGTGKTASVRSIVAELQTEQYKGLLPEFNFISLNGMELRHPFDAYIKLWEAISGTKKERLTAGDSVYELENYFCGDQKGGSSHSDSEDEISRLEDEGDFDVTERPVTVLMLDEIDYLITKKETLVYNFFDWPLRATTARLVVIGISNTINLPEKLSIRVQSRIGGERCHFRSYNVEDTETILKTRLGMLGNSRGHPVFEEDAIKFAARKTANLSGDIRKAFHMCKVAAETVAEEYISGKRQLAPGSRPLVRISDVQKGSRDMFTSIVLKAVSCSTDYEALLLISLGALKRGQDDRSFQVKDILTKIESIANASGEPRYMDARLSFADVLGMVNRLGDAGVIQLNTYTSSPFPYVSTHLHSYEILASYRDTRHSKLADRHLANQRLF